MIVLRVVRIHCYGDETRIINNHPRRAGFSVTWDVLQEPFQPFPASRTFPFLHLGAQPRPIGR
jgi:hypothetical protein